MALDSAIIKEAEYTSEMRWDLVEKWADGIPFFSKSDPGHPEWKATPVFPIDLTSDGYGVVHVKNEADSASNPTKTIKDRVAWELTALFRDFARGLYLQRKEGAVNGSLSSIQIPRLCYVTAGNVGRAVSSMFERFELPPMKLLVDSSIHPGKLERLKGLHADIYLADLSRESLTPARIKQLTNNQNGVDITSVAVIEPNAIFYDLHVHEAFNENPDEIFVPYGSGRLMENYITWQARNARNKDPRLNIPVGKITRMSILGAEPEEISSIADKLTTHHNPFVMHGKDDLAALSALSFTGENTGIYSVSEPRIAQAYVILSRYCETEPSAAAGLALYMQRFDEEKVNPAHKVLVVNTGRGI